MGGPSGERKDGGAGRRGWFAGGRWLVAGTVVVGLEAALILALAWVPPETFDLPSDPPIIVSLVDPPPPPPPAPQPEPAEAPA
ncbi:MAG: hypothetical protein ACRED4_06125, partial [Brevundimonas sp.]